jgi:GST-like protein
MPQPPIELHYWPTPNGHKISIMLEECGLPYEIKPVNIGKGDQFKPDFLKIAPNNRMPAIIDRAPQGRRGGDLGVRVRRDPGISRRKDRQVFSGRRTRPQ